MVTRRWRRHTKQTRKTNCAVPEYDELWSSAFVCPKTRNFSCPTIIILEWREAYGGVLQLDYRSSCRRQSLWKNNARNIPCCTCPVRHFRICVSKIRLYITLLDQFSCHEILRSCGTACLKRRRKKRMILCMHIVLKNTKPFFSYQECTKFFLLGILPHDWDTVSGLHFRRTKILYFFLLGLIGFALCYVAIQWHVGVQIQYFESSHTGNKFRFRVGGEWRNLTLERDKVRITLLLVLV